MSGKAWIGAAALALAGTSGVAWACADSGCEVSWTLAAQEMDCASRAMLAPGNDTRVNMLLLLRDRGGLDTAALKPVEVEYEYDTGGETFYSWRNLNAGLFPGRYDYWSGFGAKAGDRRGSRCVRYGFRKTWLFGGILKPAICTGSAASRERK